MEQVTFADVEYEGKKRRTRRELFLERILPWERLEARIRPLSEGGPGAAAVLRSHLQLFYKSDPGMEDMLYRRCGGSRGCV